MTTHGDEAQQVGDLLDVVDGGDVGRRVHYVQHFVAQLKHAVSLLHMYSLTMQFSLQLHVRKTPRFSGTNPHRIIRYMTDTSRYLSAYLTAALDRSELIFSFEELKQQNT